MRRIFRHIVIIAALLLTGVLSAPATLAQGAIMPAPSPGFKPLAPPCEANSDAASCAPQLTIICTGNPELAICEATPEPDSARSPIDNATKIIEAEIKALKEAGNKARQCLDNGGAKTCETPITPPEGQCPETTKDVNCTGPDAPADQAINDAIKFIEGLLLEPETNSPATNEHLADPPGVSEKEATEMVQEAMDTLRNDLNCAELAKLTAQKEQTEFELEKTTRQVFRMYRQYLAIKRDILNTKTEFLALRSELQNQLETMKRLRFELRSATVHRIFNQSEVNFITQSYEKAANLKQLLARLDASRERISRTEGARIEAAYVKYLNRITPIQNIRMDQLMGLQTLDGQIKRLSALCQ